MTWKAALAPVLCVCSLAAADVAVVDEIIAKVNGEIVTRSEIERMRIALATDLAREQGLKGEALDAAVRKHEADLLREKIDQLLAVQKAKELNLSVETDLSKYLAGIRLQNKMADEEKFAQFVREQTGQTYEDWKNEMRNNMLSQRVIQQEVGRGINIPKADIEKFYEEHKAEFMREERVFLSEIFVSTEGKDAAGIAAAEKKLKEIVVRIRRGERFHDVARDYSDAPSAKDMGELGPHKRGDLIPELEKAVFALERNGMTEPLKRPNGWLILRVDERHKAGQASLEEVENEVRGRLFEPRFKPKIRDYFTQLRKEAFLEIKEGYVDSGAAPDKDTKWSDPAQLKPETVTKEEVAEQTRRKRLLWAIPIPGTKTAPKSSSN